ncbi:MAG: FKBP-type peptidyl-prolyl cis-trans isomerase [Treponema sp.]|jgi:FKBP-type peptidyl-prolyl cis-trans isomerase|nr:FKBP-type peptidyl-prolyl cis-trans isomerase [Treponema sp.]
MSKVKKFSVLLVLVFLAAGFFLACKKGEVSHDALDKDTSYAFGMLLASQLGELGVMGASFDYEALMEGFRAYNEAEETRLTPNQAMDKINTAITQLQRLNDEQTWLEGEKNREEGEAYLAQNRERSGVITTPSGLQYEIITQGNGEKPGPIDRVSVHYEGTFINGDIFDSSYMRGTPVEFGLDEVVAGWTEGLQLMNAGSTYRFVIPSDLAYGPGRPGIPPNSTLVFRVELLSIVR